jgi:hypothetical protein
VADIVGGVALIAYGPESPVSERVRLAAEIVKLIDDAFAEEYPPAAVIVAEILQVPSSTNATRPDEELIVHTEVVELEYDLVPIPTPSLGVAVIVGLLMTSNKYEVV